MPSRNSSGPQSEYGRSTHSGRLSSMSDATGFVQNYAYDAAGQVLKVSYTRYKSDGTTALTEAKATRYDLLDFIQRTWDVHVSTVALHHFCKKFGLDRATRAAATAPKPAVEPAATRSAARGAVPSRSGAGASRKRPHPRQISVW